MAKFKTFKIGKTKYSREQWEAEVNERVALITQGFTLEDVDYSKFFVNLHWRLNRTPEFTANNMVKALIRQMSW